MARSLAAVIQEKDSLLRRNRELERAITPVIASQRGTPTTQNDRNSPWASGRGSPSLSMTPYPASPSAQQPSSISPPHPPTHPSNNDRLPPRSPSVVRASYQAMDPTRRVSLIKIRVMTLYSENIIETERFFASKQSTAGTFGTPPPSGGHLSPSPFHLIGNGTPPHYLVTNKIEPGAFIPLMQFFCSRDVCCAHY